MFKPFFLRFRWLVLGLIVGILGTMFFVSNIKNDIESEQKTNQASSVKMNIDYITGTIRNMSDLISSELYYTGVVNYKNNEDKWHSFLTGEEFLMVYDAEVKAGIDLSLVSLYENENNIRVEMPEANIRYKKVIPESIKFYDTKKAIIKGNGKEQGIEAQIEAENDINKNANIEKLLVNAEEQAKKVIEGLIKEVVGNKSIEFVIMENELKEATSSDAKITVKESTGSTIQ